MALVLLVSLITLWSPNARADATLAACDNQLNELRPAFDTDLRIRKDQPLVTYQGVTFDLSPIEYELLKIIISAPREMIPYDDIISSLWGSNGPADARDAVGIVTSQLRKRFDQVNPAPNKLRTCWGKGLYWARDNHERISHGRVAVARFIHEGYADSQTVSLQQQEHASLTAALSRPFIKASDANIDKHTTFMKVVCILNRKFIPILGVNILAKGPHGSGLYCLNKDLRAPNDSVSKANAQGTVEAKDLDEE